MKRFNAFFHANGRGRSILAVCLVVAVTAGCSRSQDPALAAGAPPPAAVNALDVSARALPLELEYAAQLRGIREVEVRARVSGILLERLYREGEPVEAGDLLFRIDPDPFRAAAARARAELGVQQASLEQARRERDRIVPLHEQRLASLRERDTALAAFESAEAAVAAAQAALESAELDLSYTDVRAPIGGLTSREARSEGSLVVAGSDSSLLAQIVQADRLYVEFAAPDAEAALLRTAIDEGVADIAVQVLDTRGGVLAPRAEIEFVAPRVDDSTGTVAIRAVLDNSSLALTPGRVVRARILGLDVPDALVVPKRALMHGAQGPYVWRIDAGDIVSPQPVTLGVAVGNDVAVASGLSPGDRIVVDGLLKVQPGAAVSVTQP